MSEAEHEYMTYDEARTRKVAAEAAIAELELAKIKGDLADVAAVVSAWEDVLAALKGKLLSIPTKMGPIFAADDDALSIQGKLEAQIRECLDELSNYQPLSDPAGTGVAISQLEEGDGDTEAAAKANRKPVGRPKKTAKFAK
jgi:hypothetical protein